jgi:competence ComEA-like helix-hairpin-helix protein
MNIFKSHFWYNKSQRNGIFFLGVIILIFQAVIVFVDFSSDAIVDTETTRIVAFRKQLDSLKAIGIANLKPKIYPFNPNYITDYKGAQLGMSLEQIDSLLAFRQTKRFVNSIQEFQEVTNISDSLLNSIAPYFKFPDWVVNGSNKRKVSVSQNKSFYPKKPKHKRTTTDINKATKEDLQTIYGIGVKLSERIIKYRSKLQGFSTEKQLYEVWGLEQKTATTVMDVFKVLELPNIQKSNVNSITFRELLKNPYIDYELCKMIFNYRDEVAELQDISELKNIIGFPLDLYDRIVLYLVAQ